MQLRKVRIENFRAIKETEVLFVDALGAIRPVTVLAGPNGSGKTSVLFAIIQALRGVMGYRTTDVPEPEELDIHRPLSIGGLSPTPPSISVTLDVKFGEEERTAIRTVMAEVSPEEELVDLPNGTVRAVWKYPPERKPDGTLEPTWFLNRTDPSYALPWFHGRKNAISGWTSRRFRDRTLLDRIGGIYLFPQDRSLRSRVMGERVTQDEDFMVAAERKGRGVSSVWGILEYLSNYSRSRPEGVKTQENWEQRIREGFNRICAPKEYLGFMYRSDDPLGAPYFKDNGSTYPLEMAASGEQVIIEYLARLTYPSPMNHSIILIDEPEIHLHPAWIRQLYLALPKIGIGNQYIVTTHSTELYAAAARDQALIEMGQLIENT
ncbi:MAG: AAA family ATPase [Candidatus Korobacteraceae bacterium]|jgi:putative AbiEii toxin of type IV toxin-antitoxin system/AAA domain-containing protein